MIPVSMSSTIISTIAGFLVYAVSIWATYSPGIRATRLYWVIGMSAAVVGHGIWTYLVQNLEDERRVLMLALIWDVGFAALSLTVPAILLPSRMRPIGYVGFALIALGALLVKEFGFAEIAARENEPMASPGMAISAE